MLERKLQKDEDNRFPCWVALIIISFVFLFVGCFSLGVKGKNNKLFIKYFGLSSSGFTSAVESVEA